MVSKRSNAVDGVVAVMGAVIGIALILRMCRYANVQILADLLLMRRIFKFI
jgi:hypothetical protein